MSLALLSQRRPHALGAVVAFGGSAADFAVPNVGRKQPERALGGRSELGTAGRFHANRLAHGEFEVGDLGRIDRERLEEMHDPLIDSLRGVDRLPGHLK